LNTCKDLVDLVTDGLYSGNLLSFYLGNGNYTLASDIINKWHLSFTKFNLQFIPIDIPLEIIAQNSNVFYTKKLNTMKCFFSWLFVLALASGLYILYKSFAHSNNIKKCEISTKAVEPCPPSAINPSKADPIEPLTPRGNNFETEKSDGGTSSSEKQIHVSDFSNINWLRKYAKK